MGETVAFLSVCGNDSEWDMIHKLSSPFMNLDHVQAIESANTGSYTATVSPIRPKFSAILRATPPTERVEVTGFEVSGSKSLITLNFLSRLAAPMQTIG